MGHHRTDDNFAFLVIAVVVAIGAITVWKFSTFFGLDFKTGGIVFFELLLLIITAGAAWKFGFIEPLKIWPILLAIFWACWWPALDYWASQQYPSFFTAEEMTLWWAAWYTKWGVFVGILGIGYLIKKIFQDDYY